MDEICDDTIRDDEHDGDEKMKIGEMLFVFLVKFTNKQKNAIREKSHNLLFGEERERREERREK